MRKPIEGWEGFYEIDETGRVFALARTVHKTDGTTQSYVEKEMAPSLTNRNYMVMKLSRVGVTKKIALRMMLAKAFIPNPGNLPCVAHIDGDPLNTAIENLEWVGVRGNIGPFSIERVLENYTPVPESGCWIWLGGWNKNNYGGINSRDESIINLAHRFFYTHLVGPIADGLMVCHKCDTPPCVNPDHLFVGTHMDNMRDMWAKGRAAYQNQGATP